MSCTHGLSRWLEYEDVAGFRLMRRTCTLCGAIVYPSLGDQDESFEASARMFPVVFIPPQPEKRNAAAARKEDA